MPLIDCGNGCAIECRDGGACVYNHNTGKCFAFGRGRKPRHRPLLGDGAILTAVLVNISVVEFATALGFDSYTANTASSEPVTIGVTGKTFTQLLTDLGVE